MRERQATDSDDNPELTPQRIDGMRPAGEVLGKRKAASLLRARGRPRLGEGERKQQVNLRLSPDALAAWRATGDGWQTRMGVILAALVGDSQDDDHAVDAIRASGAAPAVRKLERRLRG